MLTVLAMVFPVRLAAGYFGYGRWIARQFMLDDSRQTPANAVNDEILCRRARLICVGNIFETANGTPPRRSLNRRDAKTQRK